MDFKLLVPIDGGAAAGHVLREARPVPGVLVRPADAAR